MSGLDSAVPAPGGRAYPLIALGACGLLLIIYWMPLYEMYVDWGMVDSYYSHGYLIAPICIFLVWRRRHEIANVPRDSSALGYVFIVGSSVLLLLGDFLGFGVFRQISLVPMLAGVLLLLQGTRRTSMVWFPLIFLFMMIPIPSSITQSFVLNLKLAAAEAAVQIARALTLPMVREGSFIHFKQDHLLIGDVCGGLRSLIALFAIGMLTAYFSRTKMWARICVLILAGPIAVAANIFRILMLCIVGYFWGSPVASGRFHDVSGVLIFAVAFALFFTLEGALRKIAPSDKEAT